MLIFMIPTIQDSSIIVRISTLSTEVVKDHITANCHRKYQTKLINLTEHSLYENYKIYFVQELKRA